MRDPEQMTGDEKLATIFGVGGIAPIGTQVATEYDTDFREHPSALMAWYFTIVTLILFPAALVAVPLAVRAARRGNRFAWLAAGLAVVAFVANITLLVVWRR